MELYRCICWVYDPKGENREEMENLEVFESGIVPAYELIKSNYETEPPTISARELHKKMEVKYDFARWVNSNFKEFVENVDFSGGHIDVRGNQYGGTQTIEDYNLSVDMAKHLCRMSKTEKGKICRQYLIDLEKAWNTPEQILSISFYLLILLHFP